MGNSNIDSVLAEREVSRLLTSDIRYRVNPKINQIMANAPKQVSDLAIFTVNEFGNEIFTIDDFLLFVEETYGYPPDDAIKFLRHLEALGAIDTFNLS